MNWLKDTRTKSLSAMTEMTIGEYIEIAEKPYSEEGGLSGQRDALTTKSAKQIRKIMLDDLSKGAVLPPLVIGIVVNENEFNELHKNKPDNILEHISKESLESLAIIDGMQRTTALQEAVEQKSEIKNSLVRIEWWISKNVQSLIYRMMVLNTGQVPWNMARQMSVVFRPMIKEIKNKISDIANIMTPEDPGRRTKPGEYSSDTLVDLYLSFSNRKTKVDTKEAVSDKFAKLDLIENVGSEQYQENFYEVLRVMAAFDHEFSRFSSTTEGRFSKGKALFGTHPARIGFAVAAGQMIMGRAGTEKPPEQKLKQLQEFQSGSKKLLTKIKSLRDDELEDFFRLSTLEEILNSKSGKVGDRERNLFLEAFKVLFSEYDAIDNFEVCWRAD